MELEEYANVEWTLKMNAEQWAIVMAVFQQFYEEHGSEPEAQEFVQTLKGLNVTRTR